MNTKVVIRDLFIDRLEKTGIKCVKCNFWFDCNEESLLKRFSDIKSISDAKNLLKHKLYEKTDQKKLTTFVSNGGMAKGAFKNGKCAGMLIAGDYNLFPKLKSFRVYPPDPKSIFLGCIFVEPSYRGAGIKKKLLIELEKDLLKKNIGSIETIGKRLDDDTTEDEFENSPLLSFKFLINNGFYLKKNDKQYPLLRLDLKSIAKSFSTEKLLLEKLAYKETVRSPAIIREK
jgi:ribosomal protein S18 acetylase RimI-like enzyme